MIAWTISWLGNFNLPGKTAYLDNIHFLGRFKTYREKKNLNARKALVNIETFVLNYFLQL